MPKRRRHEAASRLSGITSAGTSKEAIHGVVIFVFREINLL